MRKKITKQHRCNLKLLVKGLRTLSPSYKNLRMDTFFSSDDEDENYINHKVDNPCDTCACMVGHAPSFGIGRMELDFNSFNWHDYCQETFGCGMDSNNYNYSMFDFLFGEHWENDIGEGIARIQYFLNSGVPVDSDGIASYLYTDTYK